MRLAAAACANLWQSFCTRRANKKKPLFWGSSRRPPLCSDAVASSVPAPGGLLQPGTGKAPGNEAPPRPGELMHQAKELILLKS